MEILWKALVERAGAFCILVGVRYSGMDSIYAFRFDDNVAVTKLLFRRGGEREKVARSERRG